jgi:hypothetical protein
MTPEQRRDAVARTPEWSADRLREIAAGPLMDANRIYLPAGTLSEAEYRAREARILRGEAP